MTPAPRRSLLPRWFVLLVAGAIVLVILVQGRFFLIPLVIAILIFALPSEAIDRLARLRVGPVTLPFWLANVAALLLLAAALLAIVSVLSWQIEAIVAAAPRYAGCVEVMIADLFLGLGEDVAASVRAALADIDLVAAAGTLAGSAGYMLSTILLIVLYVGFLFVERTHARAKLAHLFPNPDRAREFARIVGAIWGVVGMFLAVPITVVAMIVCAHVPRLRPIAVLLSADGNPPGPGPENGRSV